MTRVPAAVVCGAVAIAIAGQPSPVDARSVRHDAAQYTIESLNAPFPEFVASGNSVAIRVTGPDRSRATKAQLRLNRRAVTPVLSWDPATRSLHGMLTGLRTGTNVVEVYPSARSTRAAARLVVSMPTYPVLVCGALTSRPPPIALEQPGAMLQLDSVTLTAESGGLPEFCLVKGRINPRIGVDNTPFAIGFELRLPTAWSGRFFFQGGGGNDGVVNPALGNPRNGGAPALARGFAVVATDGGHSGTSAASYGFDPQARIDHAYNAYDKTALVAKAIVAAYYGKAPDKSYFVGCSGGGRQGMMFTQRFPRYFNGVIAGAPAMRVATGASSAAAWQTIAFNAAAPDVNGQRLLSQAFSDVDLGLVARKTLEACDANDGIVDGIVHNAAACRFDPAILQCPGAKTDSCLSPVQVAALKKAFSAPVNSRGERLYSSWPYDAGITGADWRAWKLGTSTTSQPNSRFVALIEDALKHEFFTPPDPAFSLFNYNFDTDPARQVEYGKLYDTWPNATLTEFQQAGGKLILWNGMSDPIFSANETIEYYERLVSANGAQRAASFARLYLVPGMNHCGGGPATDTYDALTRLIDWVENGNAPNRIIASGATFPGRTRPLCRYPSYARYAGAGNPEAAASFVCQQPD